VEIIHMIILNPNLSNAMPQSILEQPLNIDDTAIT